MNLTEDIITKQIEKDLFEKTMNEINPFSIDNNNCVTASTTTDILTLDTIKEAIQLVKESDRIRQELKDMIKKNILHINGIMADLIIYVKENNLEFEYNNYVDTIERLIYEVKAELKNTTYEDYMEKK